MKMNRYAIFICLLVGNITVLTGAAEKTELQKTIKDAIDALTVARDINHAGMIKINDCAFPFSESTFKEFSPDLRKTEQMLKAWGISQEEADLILQPHKVYEKFVSDCYDPRSIRSTGHIGFIVDNRKFLKKFFYAASKALKEEKSVLAAGETKRVVWPFLNNKDFEGFFSVDFEKCIPGAEPIDYSSVSDEDLYLVIRKDDLARVEEYIEEEEKERILAAENASTKLSVLVAALRAAADAKDQIALQGAAAAAKS
jgi:hypothetical protein